METVHFIKTEEISERVEAIFASEKHKLSSLFPDADIEHIGATSVPGSITKGDLDINVRVAPKDFQRARESLAGLYQINQPDNWTSGFASFKDHSRDLGVQLTALGSVDDFFVAQREYLKNHPEKVTDLDGLKLKFEGKSMDEYREEKGIFFEKLKPLQGTAVRLTANQPPAK
jgi:GrpB-like predicted nucleotidyltransferase (UPF0157 family)